MRRPEWAPIAGLLALAACGPVEPPGPGEPAVEIVVPSGSTFSAVTDSLAAHDLIGNRTLFRALARIRRIDRSVKAGLYRFPPDAGTWTALDLLARGKTATVRFTVPEGLTLLDVADLAREQLGLAREDVLAAARDRALVDSIAPGAPSLEGFLFPETYLLPANVTAPVLVRAMVDGFRAAWPPAWDARLDSLGLSRLALVTLASIVEGEAKEDSEREVIAGVYWNRLRIGMALQADPTVQYAIQLRTGRRKPRLLEVDYRIDSPYNTYLHAGLPPAPVLSPSRRSLEAALYPAEVPYLFFVAGPDGRHTFTRTYEEHLRAVAEARREFMKERAW